MKTVLIITGIAVALIAVWAFRRFGNGSSGTSAIPDDLDGKVLKQLVAAGSDLSKPHNVEFFLYFPDEAHASDACKQLTAEGYTGRVERAAKEPEWLCFLTQQIVPSHATMVNIRSRMEALARAGNGKYDGWGTEVSR